MAITDLSDYNIGSGGGDFGSSLTFDSASGGLDSTSGLSLSSPYSNDLSGGSTNPGSAGYESLQDQLDARLPSNIPGGTGPAVSTPSNPLGATQNNWLGNSLGGIFGAASQAAGIYGQVTSAQAAAQNQQRLILLVGIAIAAIAAVMILKK